MATQAGAEAIAAVLAGCARIDAGCACAAVPVPLRAAASTPLAPSSAATRLFRDLPMTSGTAGEDDLAGGGGVAVLRLPGDGDRRVAGQGDRRPQLDGARAAHVEGADGDQPVRPLHPGLVVEARRGWRQARDVQLDGQPG